MPDDFLRAAGVDRFTAIITLTHDPRIDDMALMEALGLDAFYVGGWGHSVLRPGAANGCASSISMKNRLRACTRAVGLDIGSKRPLEIAIAILAELIALRRGQS